MAKGGNRARLGGAHRVDVFDQDGQPVDIIETETLTEHGGVERYKLTVDVEAKLEDLEPDDLTVIEHLGKASAHWLSGYAVRSFEALAVLSDTSIAHLATDANRPKGVTEERLSEWRSAAGERVSSTEG